MRLPPVLAASDFDPVELQAARLDGEVYDLAGAFCLIGELETPTHRARAVLADRSPRLIAELHTAAWVWGAATHPDRLEFAVTPDARARLSPGHRVTVREIVYAASDLASLDGHRVTTPVRTAVDLARFVDPFPVDVVARLAELPGFTFGDAIALLESRGGIPAKNRARRRLADALEAHAARRSGG
jgi:hypothetical protein